MDSLPNEHITILVGEDGQEREFIVRKDLISLHSGYFRAACYGGFLEQFQSYIDFREEDASTFEYFIHWMYEDEPDDVTYAAHWLCRLRTYEGHYDSEIEEEMSLYELLKFWRLADRLCAPTLKNFLIDSIRSLREGLHEVQLTENACFIFNHTLNSDPLRKILMEQMARNSAIHDPKLPHRDMYKRLRMCAMQTNLKSLVVEKPSDIVLITGLLKEIMKESQDPLRHQWRSQRCLFHYHGIQNGGACAVQSETLQCLPRWNDMRLVRYQLDWALFRITHPLTQEDVNGLSAKYNYQKRYKLAEKTPKAEDMLFASKLFSELENMLQLDARQFECMCPRNEYCTFLKAMMRLPMVIPRDREFHFNNRIWNFIRVVDLKLFNKQLKTAVRVTLIE